MLYTFRQNALLSLNCRGGAINPHVLTSCGLQQSHVFYFRKKYYIFCVFSKFKWKKKGEGVREAIVQL